ncbi:GAF domain-containing protein [Halomonas sp. HL-93]|uniref:GAF domain-containing protein n=1 Tax=Halomonas sp. HL-93 TaxID=1666906 RepID=UPI0006D9DD41|nr:GAF domain-containing protein [Halomonas sp. HL-93]KPQ22023.1 MAG: GAF domain-containing protein [Halomonas sp. HL-93]SBR48470.1 GAF domain-containing protein [Halomonas sp. HL-93]
MSADTVDYDLLDRQLAALLDSRDWLTNSAQTCAFIMQALPHLNWVGFYLQRTPEMLALGPFQGKPACHPIPFSKGVCGAAARKQVTQRIDDVHSVADHIACDSASRAELVVPIVNDGQLWGVLDIDSPLEARFSHEDQTGIEALIETFKRQTDLPLWKP